MGTKWLACESAFVTALEQKCIAHYLHATLARICTNSFRLDDTKHYLPSTNFTSTVTSVTCTVCVCPYDEFSLPLSLSNRCQRTGVPGNILPDYIH